MVWYVILGVRVQCVLVCDVVCHDQELCRVHDVVVCDVVCYDERTCCILCDVSVCED